MLKLKQFFFTVSLPKIFSSMSIAIMISQNFFFDFEATILPSFVPHQKCKSCWQKLVNIWTSCGESHAMTKKNLKQFLLISTWLKTHRISFSARRKRAKSGSQLPNKSFIESGNSKQLSFSPKYHRKKLGGENKYLSNKKVNEQFYLFVPEAKKS